MTADDIPQEDDPRWAETLTLGHRGIRRRQQIFRYIPSTPRCKVCYGPFGGVGGIILRPWGVKPSRKNPNVCVFCCEGMPHGGAEVDIAVLFADVRGSTALGERLGARELAKLLNSFYHAATETLIAHDAIIDKLIGDEVMALFLPGIAGESYRARAVDAACDLRRAIGTGENALLPIGIGVHAGPAFVGNFGAGGVVDFTAVGDTVNTAARLQGQAQAGEIALSEAVYAAVASRFPDAVARRAALRGKGEELEIRILATS